MFSHLSDKREKKIHQRYLVAYGRLRSEFIKYHPFSLSSQIVEYLYTDFDLKDIEQLRKAPWIQLLLIKYILTDPDCNTRKPEPTRKQTLRSMNLAWKLNGRGRLPNEYPNLTLFMRVISFQQFPYQHGINLTHLARQKMLFSDLPENHKFKELFLESHGISLNDFLELSVCLAAKFLNKPDAKLTRNWFAPLEDEYGTETIDAYLHAISLDSGDTIEQLKLTLPGSRDSDELLEETLFTRFPLLKQGNEYICWYPTVLFRCLECWFGV